MSVSVSSLSLCLSLSLLSLSVCLCLFSLSVSVSPLSLSVSVSSLSLCPSLFVCLSLFLSIFLSPFSAVVGVSSNSVVAAALLGLVPIFAAAFSQGRSLLLLSPAGTGKTLAYTLPLLSRLYLGSATAATAATAAATAAAAAGGRPGHPHCPRLLILVPTRELARQIFNTAIKPLAAAAAVRDISNSSSSRRDTQGGGAPLGGPLSGFVFAGGGSYATETRALRMGVDVAVCTPARLLLHLRKGNLLLHQLQQLVIDEADALCDTFYANETRFVLSLVSQQRHFSSSSNSSSSSSNSSSSSSSSSKKGVQLVFVAATHSGALASFLRDFEPDGTETKFLRYNTTNISSSSSSSSSRGLLQFVSPVIAGSLHCVSPLCQQQFVSLGGSDRLSKLAETLGDPSTKMEQTLVFCNTVRAAR